MKNKRSSKIVQRDASKYYIEFNFFKMGWNLAKFISNNEGFIFGATENRCEEEFWKIIGEMKKK